MFKIFVGNLSYNTTADSIKKLFSRHADVNDIAMATDPETGKLRGFAIVMIRDETQGRAAIAALRNSRLDGRTLLINEARKKGDPPPPKRENRRGSAPSGGSRGNFRSRPPSRGSAPSDSRFGSSGNFASRSPTGPGYRNPPSYRPSSPSPRPNPASPPPDPDQSF